MSGIRPFPKPRTADLRKGDTMVRFWWDTRRNPPNPDVEIYIFDKPKQFQSDKNVHMDRSEARKYWYGLLAEGFVIERITEVTPTKEPV